MFLLNSRTLLPLLFICLLNRYYKMQKFKWFTSWRSKARKLKGTFYISIEKGVARAMGLQKGERLYAYRGEDDKERPVMMVYLDKKDMYGQVEDE